MAESWEWYIIDVETRSQSSIMRRLKKLKTTMRVEDGGMYHQNLSYAQIHVFTSKTEEQLGNWLYNLSGPYTGYVDVCKR